MRKLSLKTYFIVRNRTTGGAYLVNRTRHLSTTAQKYRWEKERRSRATCIDSYNVAQKARQRYGGEIVRCVEVTLPNKRVLALETVVSAE